ncbi:MAG TPA: ABC transporter substrate-binding protein [Agromyces sp.]
MVLTAGCRNAPIELAGGGVADADERDGRVVVASFNFGESRLVAEIYARALENAGVPVRREVNLGPRELVAAALLQGHVDVVPEYLGTAAAALGAGTSGSRVAADALDGLRSALEPYGLRALAPAPAEDQNAVVVRRTVAEELGLASVSDLAPHARSLTLGGPPECPLRRYCGRGLDDVYGLTFAEFVPLDGADRTRRALVEDVIDVGIMFTTDPYLAARDLVALADDRHLQPPENIVPIARSAVLDQYDEATAALDQISMRLTTTALRLLNWRVSVAGHDPRREAEGWLIRQGLLPR